VPETPLAPLADVTPETPLAPAESPMTPSLLIESPITPAINPTASPLTPGAVP
jgi:hypothetical protein